MNNRSIMVFLLILLSGIATSWIIDVSEEPPVKPESARNEPDLYMVNPRISQFDPAGTLQHRINAERLTHFPLTDVTTLKVPNITLYSAPGSPPWDIAAKNGRMLPKAQLREQTVELWDDVLAIKDQGNGEFVNIQTQSLLVFPDQDFAETDKRVLIDNSVSRTSAGGGMKAHFESGRYEFFRSSEERVTTVYIPATRVDAG